MKPNEPTLGEIKIRLLQHQALSQWISPMELKEMKKILLNNNLTVGQVSYFLFLLSYWNFIIDSKIEPNVPETNVTVSASISASAREK
jgi:hypothetical protein